jgi:hypothetical protein
LPWDKDNTFKANDYPVWPDGLNENVLTRMLLARTEWRDLFLQVLLECADFAESRVVPTRHDRAASLPWLRREIEVEYQQIADAARADGRKPQSNRLFEEAVDGLREFAHLRPGFVRAFVARARSE